MSQDRNGLMLKIFVVVMIAHWGEHLVQAYQSKQKFRPVRPKPDWTSSIINKMPWRSQIPVPTRHRFWCGPGRSTTA